MTSKKEYSLIEAIEAVGREVAPDVDIVTVKVLGPAKNPVVRVYIDHEDGVTFDVLCDTQKWISDILDQINPFPGSYTLEVSSPGPDRPLRKLKHFRDVQGCMAKIKTKEPIDKRAAFTGVINSVEDEVVEIILDEGKKGKQPKIKIAFENISSANLKG